MEIKATPHPGQNGTKELQAKYGDQLVCVRYRYDKIKKKRFKTIELIIDEKEWIPSSGAPARKKEFFLDIAAREMILPSKQNQNRRRHLGPQRKRLEVALGKNRRTRTRKQN